jgi:hemoglobin-like flavoprotein
MPQGSLRPQDIALVRTTFDRTWAVAGDTAEQFYRRLFEIAPHMRPLFPEDMRKQSSRFMAKLAVLVGSIDRPDHLAALTGALARQHVEYGVQASHYPMVGAALLWALERSLGEDWTPEVATAWTGLYEALSTCMIEEAYGSSEGP